METLVQANIFFFITSLAVIAVSFVVVLLVLRLRKLVKSLHQVVDKLRDTTDYVGEEAKDLVEDIKQSPIFRLFFPRRKKASRTAQESGTIDRKPRRKV